MSFLNMAVDYTEVKRMFAEKLANDADGMGRFESAFYHTMKWVYLQGVEDGQQAARYSDGSHDHIIRVDDKRDGKHENQDI